MQRSRHLYLTGYRGTGKTSVGLMLAKTLDCQVIDLDQCIEERAGKSIREIFDQGGESMFRQLETEALSEVAAQPQSVVSLGGGAILSAANRQMIRRGGVCFWLDADAETIFSRIQGDESTAQRRPALTSLEELDEIRQLLSQRRELYAEAADHRIETAGKPIQQVVREIRELLQDDPKDSGD
jgi:shikimate kinase